VVQHLSPSRPLLAQCATKPRECADNFIDGHAHRLREKSMTDRTRTYRWDAPRRAVLAHSVDVLTLRGRSIAEITAFHTSGSLREFGLPDRWSAG
jgi:hypothetical protein